MYDPRKILDWLSTCNAYTRDFIVAKDSQLKLHLINIPREKNNAVKKIRKDNL